MNIICFHAPNEDYGFLSNWYTSKFELDNIIYISSEQYMMFRKAITFNDHSIAKQIMLTDDPAKIKELGRAVHNYNDGVWNGIRQIVVYKGLLAKFSQNKELKEKLLATGDSILAEAAQSDRVWGIGVSMHDNARFDMSKWKGKNLLGFTLMQVRKELQGESSSSFDTELFEKTINEMFPGLTMFVRDVNLNPQCAGKYHKGMIIREKAFTDASSRVMGMKTSHRFAILSNHMADLSAFEHGTNRGLCVAQSDSHFLVLDIYKYCDVTQILLLHLPDDERWQIFKNVESNFFDDITKMSRQRFEAKCRQAVIPELATDDWLQRCALPLGMDINGNLFEL